MTLAKYLAAAFCLSLRIKKEMHVDANFPWRWQTVVVNFRYQVFVRCLLRNGHFLCEVVMKEECGDFVAKVMLKDAESKQATMSTSSPPRPLEAKNEVGFCLSASKEALSDVWRYEASGEVCHIEFRVEMNECK